MKMLKINESASESASSPTHPVSNIKADQGRFCNADRVEDLQS